MRGLQPKEKRGLKYLLLAAKNGVSKPFASYDVLSLGSLQVTGGRFQGFLEMGASVGTLPHSLKGQSGALVHLGDESGPGAQTLQNMNVETALLG